MALISPHSKWVELRKDSYLYLQQWFEKRQVEGQAALMDVTGSYWASGARDLTNRDKTRKKNINHLCCSQESQEKRWWIWDQNKEVCNLQVSQPAGEVEDVPKVGFGVSIAAGRFGKTELLGDGVKLQRAKGKDLACLQQLFTYNTHTVIWWCSLCKMSF